MDDTECVVCGTNIYDMLIGSFQVIEWIPDEEINVLVAVYCGNHKPHYHKSQDEKGNGE